MLSGMAALRTPMALVAFLTACGGSAPPPQPAPSASPSPPTDSQSALPAEEAADTGSACAGAKASCGGGICNVKIKNACDQPVRCELAITATCDSQTGSMQANGADHGTFAAGGSGELAAQATCSGSRVVHTEIKKLSCK